jgi:hypothetical protein
LVRNFLEVMCFPLLADLTIHSFIDAFLDVAITVYTAWFAPDMLPIWQHIDHIWSQSIRKVLNCHVPMYLQCRYASIYSNIYILQIDVCAGNEFLLMLTSQLFLAMIVEGKVFFFIIFYSIRWLGFAK